MTDDTDPRQLFPLGEQVAVTVGRYAGHHGVVVEGTPDLWPAWVWVDLVGLGRQEFVSCDRLAPVDG